MAVDMEEVAVTLMATAEAVVDTVVVVEEASAAVLVVIACLILVPAFKSKAGVSYQSFIIKCRKC